VKHDPVVLAKRAALAAAVLFIHTALIAAASSNCNRLWHREMDPFSVVRRGSALV
jgi:hypothetical protein